MKPTEAETTAEVNIPAFIAAMRLALSVEEDDESDYCELRDRCFGENPDDTLEWGISEGRTQLANKLRGVFTRFGVAL